VLALGGDRVFPFNGKSLGTAFRRAGRDLGIEDLHFHDLRHEATGRLIEAGFDIPEVSLVTGHKDWKMLRRYLNLQPHLLVGEICCSPLTRASPAQRGFHTTSRQAITIRTEVCDTASSMKCLAKIQKQRWKCVALQDL
jgi:hypothetical protein